MLSSSYKTGDIFIAKSPYSDLESGKIRPVVIISPNSYNELFGDVVVLSITTKEKDPNFFLSITNSDLCESKLRLESYIRVDKPTSISKEILEYRVTSLKDETLLKLKSKIRVFYEL